VADAAKTQKPVVSLLSVDLALHRMQTDQASCTQHWQDCC